MLHDAVIFLRRRHELPALENVMRAGLLAVHVLAGLARPDTDQRVPVVGRGDRDGVDGLVLEEFPDVGERGWLLLAGADHFVEPFVQDILIHVAQGGDLDVRHGRIFTNMAIALPADAYTCHAYRIVDAGRAFHRGRARGCRGAHKEVSSIHVLGLQMSDLITNLLPEGTACAADP